MDFLWQDMTHAAFWIAALQIIGVNIILSGDNAVVIAMACMTLPPQQRLWGMILGAGVAVLLRIVFTLVIAQAMNYPVPQAGRRPAAVLGRDQARRPRTLTAKRRRRRRADNLWRAVRIVAIADIVMSLDNVIAIAASAEIAAARVDLAHAAGIKTTLIIFGLATSVPLIVAGSAILMALLERYRVLVWGGGALLGWVAGDIMATDPGLVGVFSEATLHALHVWGGPSAAHRPWRRLLHRRPAPALKLDEILAGVALVVWIIVDRISESVFGANADPLKIWGIRGVLLLLMIVAYTLARKQWHVEEQEV